MTSYAWTPENNVFGDPDNWVPNSKAPGSGSASTFSSDTAEFVTGTITNVAIDIPDGLEALIFFPGAPAYTFSITAPLTFYGAGITDDSSNAPTLEVGSTLSFLDGSSADAIIDVNASGSVLYSGLATSGASQFNNAGDVDFSGITTGTATASSIAGSGTFHLGSVALTVGSGNSGSYTVSGTIADGGVDGGTGASLIYAGSGSLILTGDNTYTGGTTISSGALQLGDGTTDGSIVGNIQIDKSTALLIDETGTLTLSGAISGGGNFTEIGGTTILTGDGSWTGGSIVEGTLQVGNGGTTGSITGVVSLGGTLAIDRSDTFTTSFRVDGGLASFEQIGTGTTIITNGISVAKTTISAGTLEIEDGTNTLGSISGNVTDDATLAFDLSQPTNLFTVNISGSGGVTQIGAGETTTIAGDSTYSGATDVEAGTLAAGNDHNSFSANSAFTVASGAVLDLNGESQTIASLAGAGTVTGGTSGGAATLTEGDSTSTVYSGVIEDGNNSMGLIKTGTGTLTLSGANTYSGATTVERGTLTAGAVDAFSADSAVTVDSGAVLDLGGCNQQIASLGGAGTVTDDASTRATLTDSSSAQTTFGGVIQDGQGQIALTISGGSLLTLTGDNTYTGGTTISSGALQLGDGTTDGSIVGNIQIDKSTALQIAEGAAGTLTLAGAISGAGNFTEIGGTTILTGDGSWTGGSIVEGTLQVGNGGTTGSITGVVSLTGMIAIDRSDTFTTSFKVTGGTGSFEQIGAGTTIITNGISVANTTISAGTLEIEDGTNTFGSISGNVTDNATLAFDFAENKFFTVNISGTGGVTQIGAGETTIAGNSTYLGATDVEAGTLSAQNSRNSFSANSAFTVASGAVLDLNGVDQTIASLAGAGTVTGGTFGGSAILTEGDSTSTVFSGVIEDGNNAIGLTKTGTGTLTLTGANTYTGGTTISDGTLQLGDGGSTGSITANVADNGTFAIDESATLTVAALISGTGAFEQLGSGTTILTAANTYGGATTISAGTLELGTGGSLSGGVTFDGAATLRLDTGTDQLAGDVAGAAAGDVFDFGFVGYANGEHTVWQQNGSTGSLLLQDGNGTTLAALTLSGVYTAANFLVMSDGQNDAQIELITPSAPVVTTGNPVVSTSGVASVPLDSTLSIADAESATLTSATVQITGGAFAGAADVLSVNTAGTAITANYSSATETLTLSGTDTLAHYQSILDLVAFTPGIVNPTNSGADPTRTVTWIVSDGFSSSAPVTTAVTISSNAPPTSNPSPPAPTSADMILERGSDGSYQIYDIGISAILASYQLGQISTQFQLAGLGGFDGPDTSDMLLRNAVTGTFAVDDVSGNNVTGTVALGQVGLEWSVAGLGNFSGRTAETDMLMRNSSSGAFEVYDLAGNQITFASSLGQVGLEWQVAGFGNFSSRAGETDMVMRNSNTGAFEVYDISNNAITSATVMGQVATQWQVAGFGDFSGNANETDLLLRNSATGAFEVYDIVNNRMSATPIAMGQVGLEWTVAGFGDFSGKADETDMLMRNSNTGAFEIYDIKNNMIASAATMGQVGTEWSVVGLAADPASGLLNGANSGLAQAMASFAPMDGTHAGALPSDQLPQSAAASGLAVVPIGQMPLT